MAQAESLLGYIKVWRKKLQSSFKKIFTLQSTPKELKLKSKKLEHSVSNMWNIKQYKTKLPLSMSFVELKPAPNNKNMYEVEYLQQYKMKFEPPKHKRDIAQRTAQKKLLKTFKIYSLSHEPSSSVEPL
jgi:hypothetical protein